MNLTDTADALVAVDPAGLVVAVNDAARTLLGLAEGDDIVELLRPEFLSGRPICPDGWPPPVMRLPGCRAIIDQDVHVTTPRGPIDVALTAAVDHGAAVLAIRDLTPRRRHERAGALLVSTVSHELRSPLASVKGYTATLLHRWDRFSDEDKRFMIEQVNHDADRVTRLINELLDLSRLESGRLALRPEWVKLGEIVNGVVEKLHFDHPDAVVDIRFVSDMPPVYADRDKVTQVLTNLIENAAKYGDPETIEVVGAAADGLASVAVSDRGEGLAPEVLPRIFSKFYRAENRMGRPTGTGLGLYIARGLIEAHGGSLTVESALGEGTIFTVKLPVGAGPQ